MVINYRKLTVMGLFFVAAILGSLCAQSVPYETGFEATETPAFTPDVSLNNQNGWTVPTGTATVQSAEKQGGTQAVMLDQDSEVRKDFADVTLSKVWVDAYFKGTGSVVAPNYPSDPPASAIVHFSQSSGIQCFNGDGAGTYETVNTGVTIDPTKWYRVSILQNYATHQWNCYITYDSTTVSQMNLGFLWNTVSNFKGFINFSGEISYLDTFRVLSGLTLDANGDGKINVADIVKCVNLMNASNPDFVLKANVDTNANGTIDSAELQAIVNNVLSKS